MKLRIYLDAHWQDAAMPCAWALLDDANNLRDSGSATLAAMPQHEGATVIVAADRVLAAAAALPKIRRNKLETALPFALEDSLADDAADAHVTPGAKLPDGRTVLHTLNKGWLGRFLAACTAARLRVRSIVPEFCLLPVRTNEWSLAWNGTQGFLAAPHGLGSALDSGSETHAPALLRLKLQQGAPAALRLFAQGNEVAPPQWSLGVPLICENQSFDWRRTPVPVDAPNLLWGKFAAPPRISELWPWLRPAVLATLLLFGVEAALTNLEWVLLAHEKRHLLNEMSETFRETFGADATIVDAPLQMRRNVAMLRHSAGVSDDADFLPLLDRFSAAAGVLPDGSVRTLRYGDGKLDVELSLAPSALDALLRHLADAGLTVQVVDKHETGSTTAAQLRIAAGGAS